MKRITLTFLVLFVAMCCMAQGMAFEATGTTLEQASVKAKSENKLIFLDCFTQWCGPCKMMAKNVFPAERVGQHMNDRFVNLKIDMETPYGAALAQRLQVQAYPTFIIFNADAQEIGRFLGGCSKEEFLARVEEKSKDHSATSMAQRWKDGERDKEFLMAYLQTLTAAYKADDACQVAEALLKGREEDFASDSLLRQVFMTSINNPFSKSFIATVHHPETLSSVVGAELVQAKIDGVLRGYIRRLIVDETDGGVRLDQEKFEAYDRLLTQLGIANADHYRLTARITVAEKQKDLDSFLRLIEEYLDNPSLDANDMQLAQWTKTVLTGDVTESQKANIKKILKRRLDEIKAGKRQPMTKMGNMILSRPTDELLEMLIRILNGEQL